MHKSLAAMSFAAVLSATLTCSAAPPVGGTPTVEETVLRGCNGAELVIIARVARLREEQKDAVTWVTAELSAVELIKGNRAQVPRTYSLPKRQQFTDQLADWLEKDMTYLMFLNSHPVRGWEGTIMRRFRYEAGAMDQTMRMTDNGFQAAVKLARMACK